MNHPVHSFPHLREGAAAAWPICLGYVPIGLAFGVLARNIGLSPWEIGLMSLLVYAGSAQFIAVSMLGGGSAAIPIILIYIPLQRYVIDGLTAGSVKG